MKPVVFITRRLPHKVMQMMDKSFKVICNEEDRNLNYNEILESAKEAQVLVSMLADNIDRKLLSSCSKLKGVCNYAVGYNNIDVEAASEMGIKVCNTPGVLTETTADLAWALLMAAARRIAESDRYCRQGRFKGWAPLLFQGCDIHHKTIGIIGAGRIGQTVAKRSKGFDMKILYYDDNVNTYLEEELKAEKCDLNGLLQNSDFISLHVPYTQQTHHLIGKKEFSLMKNTAVLINTSRGKVIVEDELIKALQNNTIAAAGLDVFYHEPEIPETMKNLDNIVIVPHIGSASYETRLKMAELVFDCVKACAENKVPPALVNP